MKRKPEQLKSLPKLEKENINPFPLIVDTTRIDLSENKKMLRNRIKNTKVEENSETESLLNKAKPIVKLKNSKKIYRCRFHFYSVLLSIDKTKLE